MKIQLAIFSPIFNGQDQNNTMMKSPEMSLRVFGLYLILVPGLGLMGMPDLILNMFGLSHGPELWQPRIIGLLAAVIGVFEILTAKNQLQVLYPWTVRLRFFAAAFMVGLWALKQVEVGILVFAAIDALGATWTWWAMNQKVRD